jgi:N utilization substance protein B
MSWINYPELLKNLFKEISENSEFQKYISDKGNSYEADKKILIYILEKILNESDELYSTLEEQSIFWNDNVDFIISMIVKTIKKFKVGDDYSTALMPKYKNDEDKEFVSQLLRKSVLNQVEYREIINKNIKNWDIERLAYIDMIILQLAITELQTFDEIPVKVTINEYIEISKYYSTEKSSTFINGILDKMVKIFKNDNQINKVGRGLIGDNEMNE